MDIICTQDDELFNSYKDKVALRKVIFHIKNIYKDHSNNFLNEYSNFNIRETVFYNIKRLLKCKTSSLGFDVFKCKKCGKKKLFFIHVNQECVPLVITNTIMNVLLLFFLNYSTLSIVMLLGLFQKKLEITFGKAEKY